LILTTKILISPATSLAFCMLSKLFTTFHSFTLKSDASEAFSKLTFSLLSYYCNKPT
jgi:hypothetical protein